MNNGLTPDEKKRLHKWIQAQAYSGHGDTDGNYLRQEELNEYLHKEINAIMTARRRKTKKDDGPSDYDAKVLAFEEARDAMKAAEDALAAELQGKVHQLIEAKDVDGLHDMTNELPKGLRFTRRIYEAMLRIEDAKKKPSHLFKEFSYPDQLRVVQTLSNEAMKSIKDGSGCRAGLYIRNVNTALRMMPLIGKESFMLKLLSDRAVKAMNEYRIKAMITDYDAALAVEDFRVEIINEVYFAFHDALALMSIKPIEIDDSSFQHKDSLTDEDKLTGEVWLTRDNWND